MAFEQDLRAYLEALEREAPADPALPLRHVDEHELHRHLLDSLRGLEKVATPAVVKQRFEDWSKKLARLARYLETLPRQLAPVDREGANGFARRVLDQAIECLEPGVSLVERMELQRIVDMFVRDENVEAYALENKLVRGGLPGRRRLTELGRGFLRLRGKDAIRWLLTNEVVQSTGSFDPWHTSHELLQEAVTTKRIAPLFVENTGYFGYSDETLDRLTGLGVLSAVVDRPEDGVTLEFRTEAAMRDVVQAVLEPGPWHTAIRALLDDERAVALPGVAISATDATIEQTKLIVHEVRNALIPVRHDLEALRSFAVEHAEQQRIETAKQGVVRVLDFVEAMAQMSELITEPHTRSEIGAVVDEALGWIDTGHRVERLPFPDAVYLLVPRTRFARAISNVVGNALQATAAAQPVRLIIERIKGGVRVVVDDGGPGVPIEHRARIFLEGVTMRQDGAGSGFGLAFARRVVEGALHGKIWCEDSDLGGARFVIEVPETSP